MATQLHTDFLPEVAPRISPAVAAHPMRTKKKLVRRIGSDYSQRLRRSFQFAFLLLNLYLGATFYFWVRQFEKANDSGSISRPPGVEGWLPIAGMMNFKYWVLTGRVPALHPAAMFLLVTFVAISFLFRKAFCGWLCPVGTISEYLWRLGKGAFGRTFRLPRKLDIGLRGLKYLLLALFGYAVASMSVAGIRAFLDGPYGIV